MLKRQKSGSVVCPNCGRLVGVTEKRCFNCGRWNPGLWGYAPVLGRLGRDFGFSEMVFGGCALLYILSLWWDRSNIGMGGFFGMLSPSPRALLEFGASGAIPVLLGGRWWTVLSAAWLHGSLLHIVFNLLWMRQLLPAMYQAFGVGRTIIIYTAGSIGGFAVTSMMVLANPILPRFLHGAPLTIGASAPLFGFFGALLVYGRRTGNRGAKDFALQWIAIGVVFGFVAGMVDNWAHFGGLAGGYLAAHLLDPAREESFGHLLGGLFCIALTVASIVASLVIPFSPELLAWLGL